MLIKQLKLENIRSYVDGEFSFPEGTVLLAGDICYEKPMAEAVMAWMRQGRASGSIVLIGDPGRTYFRKDDLIKLAEYQVETTRELEDFAIKRTCVWTLP